MARYKEYDYAQGKFIPVHFDKQIIAGTFEHTLHYLIDNEIDLSVFDLRYQNDETGAPAYDPAILLKIILYGYSRGITSSRKIARCCEENIIFMALSADTQPHFTTIADFISSLDEKIIRLFLEVLLYCDEMGLIGKEMFAVDGCKMPSNASKDWSGTKEELRHKKEKMEKVIKQILKRHREMDIKEKDKGIIEQEAKYVDTIKNKVKKIKDRLKENAPETFTQKMKRKIDSIKGRLIYNKRLGTAEPPFAHIRSILRLDRFTLRGKRKVNTQWLLYCIVHNLTKVHRYGEGVA